MKKYNNNLPDIESENAPKKKFRLFDMNRDGKGVEKDEDTTPTFKYFFKLFKRKFTKLLSVNLIMLFQIIPIIIAFFIYFTGQNTSTQTSVMYPAINGAFVASGGSPVLSLLLSQTNFPFYIPVFNTPALYFTVAILFVTALTFGWQNVGATYLMRGLVTGEPVFIISDYFYAIKRNFKQGFIVGLLDSIAITILIVDFVFFYYNGGTFWLDVMYFMIFAITIIYFFMRFYIYLMVVTFDMKIGKILKNALIFSVIGVKRNLLAALGIAVLVIIDIIVLMIFTPLGLTLPIFYLLGFGTFISTYAAYPVILKYMVKKTPADGINDNNDSDGDAETVTDNPIADN